MCYIDGQQSKYSEPNTKLNTLQTNNSGNTTFHLTGED
jgi:hypothetical protein